MTGRRTASVFVIALVAACSPGRSVSPPVGAILPNTLTPVERQAGWQLLFDGVSTRGWRNYLKQDISAGWQVVDGALTRMGPAGDIISLEKYRNFELSIDWKISSGGNSGIFYRGIEGPEAIYFSAPEMQVLDDLRHADGKSRLTSGGAAYGLYPAPGGAVKPVGEWNTARVLVLGNHVQQWLNGVSMADYQLHSVDWKGLVAASKFQQWPEYGQAAEGYIGLQDHGDLVAFRNIKIRLLP